MAINLNLPTYGDQFRAFVVFAKENANNEDTLACIGGSALLDPDGKPRSIVAKNDGDKIKSLWKNQFFGRTGDQARHNDSVRDLFKETVFKVCGAKNFNELPPAVRDVMKEGDYKVDGGHPLSARRIRAVPQAIQMAAVQEEVNKSVTPAKAGELVDGALTYINGVGKNKLVLDAVLDKEQRQMTVNLVSRYGAGLTDSNLRLFANYVVLSIASGSYNAQEAEAIARRMSKELKGVRNFSFGDPRLAKFDATLAKYYQSMTSDKLSQGDAKDLDKNGVSSQLITDIHRASFTIAGKEFSRTDNSYEEDDIIQKLEETVPNPTHRKVLTSFMSQHTGTIFLQLAKRGPLVPTSEYENIDMNSEEGRDLILGLDQNDPLFDVIGPLPTPDILHYALDMGDDGKTAKITVRYTGNILFRMANAGDCSNNPTGQYIYSLELDFDLSDPNEVKVKSAHLGQQLDVPGPDDVDVTGSQVDLEL